MDLPLNVACESMLCWVRGLIRSAVAISVAGVFVELG